MATEDILINDGDGFVSLSALAAEQVDCELPISSADDTVTLDSPSANTFTVSTGGTERFRVRNDGSVGVGNGGYAFARHTSGGTNVQSGGAAAIAYNAMYTATTDGTGATPQVFSFYSSPSIVDDPTKPIENFAHFYTAGTLPGSVKNAYGLYVAVQGGQNSYNIYASSSAPNYFAGDIEIVSSRQLRTSTVKGTADSDAQIDLGSNAIIKSGDSGIVSFQVAGAGRFTISSDDIVTSDTYTPTQPSSIATKQYADTKATLWTGTQDEYDQLGIYNLNTLYCITD